MKFSIIIPVYNVEQYLTKCLDSVVNQTYNDEYEVICVNDGSTDSSLAILEEYAKRYGIIKIVNQENRGLSEARNTGIRQAKGKYIWFIDSDDWIEDDALNILHKKINDEDIVCFNGRRYFEDGKTETPDEGIEISDISGWEYYNKYALQSRKFHFACVVLRVYKRDFLLKNNLFFEPGIYHEDNLFTPIALYHAIKIKSIPDMLYQYRIRVSSITQNINFKRIIDIITIANRLAEFFIHKTDINKSVVYKDLSSYYPNVLVLAKKYNFNTSKCFDDFNLGYYKVISAKTINVVYYFLLKIKSPLIFKYPQINKIFKKLHLI